MLETLAFSPECLPIRVAGNALPADCLPTAWQDADQSQRNQLANLLYEEVWVDGPVVEYVSFRCMASHMAARVFSVAHTAA